MWTKSLINSGKLNKKGSGIYFFEMKIFLLGPGMLPITPTILRTCYITNLVKIAKLLIALDQLSKKLLKEFEIP